MDTIKKFLLRMSLPISLLISLAFFDILLLDDKFKIKNTITQGNFNLFNFMQNPFILMIIGICVLIIITLLFIFIVVKLTPPNANTSADVEHQNAIFVFLLYYFLF